LLDAVREARATADVVVVMIHWGIELSTAPNRTQVRVARAVVGAGASVVLGSHPHVLQPVVRMDGAIVAYSLGNFLFSSPAPAASRSMILRIGILSDGSLVAASVPVRIAAGVPATVSGDSARRP
jgi:poly-gamma-glutamate synthesis protein (capsule biosynthesis protein)